MKYTLLFFVIVLMSCGSNTSNSKANGNSDKLTEEKFEDFFHQFTTDSLFQIDRVKFPFIVESRDDEDKLVKNKRAPNDWRHLTFEYSEEFAKRDVDSYTQETKVFSDSAKIELRGIDNGIYVDYLFYNIDGRWFLALARDYSD